MRLRASSAFVLGTVMNRILGWGWAGALALIVAGCADTPGAAGNAGTAAVLSARNVVETVTFPTSRAVVPPLLNARAFASLPDRGELARVDATRKVHREGAYTWHPVQLSEAHAFNAIASGELTLRAPNGEALRMRYQRHVEHGDGNWTWFGRDARGQDAVITFGEKAVFGSIPNSDGESLRLTLAGGRSWLLETDRSRVASLGTEVTHPSSPDFFIPPEQPVVDTSRVIAAAAAEQSTASGVPVVDVAVGYTPGFVGMFGGDSQARTRLTFLVDLTNQAFVTSQVNAQVRLVHALAVSYTDDSANNDALYDLTGYKPGTGTIAVPASLQPLRAARDQYGADLVSLVRRFKNATHSGCGVAWLLGGNQTTIDSSDAPFGFSIVSDSAGSLFPDGGYVCRDETFAHELGHNMGSQHDRTTATDNGTLKHGRYTYSFGYKTDSGTGNFYTIMAYGESGQTKNRVFSNPRISVCGSGGNLACGVTDMADNARSLNNTVSLIAAFRATVVSSPSVRAVRNDLDGDGKSDIVWRNPGLELQAHWLMNGRQRTAESVRAVSSIYRIIGTGDFDGDRRTDLLWTNNTNDLLWIWRSNGTGGYDVQLVSGYPAGWAVEAIGDFNGDGRSDLAWRNAAQGRFDVWLMNGPSIVATAPATVASTQRMIGSSDFDGDGYVDLLWTNATNDTLWIWRSQGTGTFTAQFLANYGNGWSVKGVTDLNADGRADIVWQNAGLGLMDYWWMGGASGTTILGSGAQPVGSIYRVIATGDFDGDGRGDLLWTNESNDLLWVWRSQGNGQFISELVDGYPPGWSVMNGGS